MCTTSPCRMKRFSLLLLGLCCPDHVCDPSSFVTSHTLVCVSRAHALCAMLTLRRGTACAGFILIAHGSDVYRPGGGCRACARVGGRDPTRVCRGPTPAHGRSAPHRARAPVPAPTTDPTPVACRWRGLRKASNRPSLRITLHSLLTPRLEG